MQDDDHKNNIQNNPQQSQVQCLFERASTLADTMGDGDTAKDMDLNQTRINGPTDEEHSGERVNRSRDGQGFFFQVL
jgi:hypothetical protein